MMIISDYEAVAILLTTDLINVNNKLLTISEFNLLNQKLKENGFSGCDALLKMPLWQLAEIKGIDKKKAELIYSLLKQSEKIESIKNILETHNIKIITDIDYSYPKTLKLKLENDAPPLLFCIGNTELLQKPALAVTGSRNTSEAGMKYAKDIGQIIAEDNKIIVSGGARGCDLIATESAIKNGGSAVWFVAEPLINISTKKIIIDWISENKICLVSHFNPFGDFEGKNALARNLFIYSLATASFVCECKSNISGTYSGASKCLKRNLSKLYVFNTNETGSEKLIQQGASYIDEFI